MWYPPSHGRDDPHYLQTDRPLHYNHPAPRQSSSFPSAQTPEQDPEVAACFLMLLSLFFFFFLLFVLFCLFLLTIEKGELNHSKLIEELMETLYAVTKCSLLQDVGYLESAPFHCPLPPHTFCPTPLSLSQTHTHAHTHFPLCQGTAARQILTNTNGFWLLLGNPSILTWVDMLSKIQTLELSHQLFMWHRWRVAIRSQAMGLGDLRCCTVASGNFEKQYPEMGGKNPYWKHKFEVSQSVCLSVVQIKISLSLYVKAMCVCMGCVELQNFCSAPSFRTAEAPVHSVWTNSCSSAYTCPPVREHPQQESLTC